MKFENIKVGDVVAMRGFGSLIKCKVTRIFLTSLEVDNSCARYSIETGNEVGKYGLLRSSVEPWTNEHDEELRKEEDWKTKRVLTRKIENYDWYSLTVYELEKVISALKEIGIDVEGTNNATS